MFGNIFTLDFIMLYIIYCFYMISSVLISKLYRNILKKGKVGLHAWPNSNILVKWFSHIKLS